MGNGDSIETEYTKSGIVSYKFRDSEDELDSFRANISDSTVTSFRFYEVNKESTTIMFIGDEMKYDLSEEGNKLTLRNLDDSLINELYKLETSAPVALSEIAGTYVTDHEDAIVSKIAILENGLMVRSSAFIPVSLVDIITDINEDYIALIDSLDADGVFENFYNYSLSEGLLELMRFEYTKSEEEVANPFLGKWVNDKYIYKVTDDKCEIYISEDGDASYSSEPTRSVDYSFSTPYVTVEDKTFSLCSNLLEGISIYDDNGLILMLEMPE